MGSVDLNMNTFQDEVNERVAAQAQNVELVEAARKFMSLSITPKYSYNFSWLGRPIIQYPQDIVIMQELIWTLKPDLIIETGIAHGGSLVFSASMLELNAACHGPAGAEVVGVDIDIRAHNRAAIEAHPLSRRIRMIEGSSVDEDIVAQVRRHVDGKSCVLVMLDSNHTHDHVLKELEHYASLVTVGSYCVVFDTVVDDLPAEMYSDRPWGPGGNPKTAVHQFLQSHPEFEIDKTPESKALMTVSPDGFLQRIS